MVPESWEQTSGWPLTSRGEAPAGRTIELLASDNEEGQRSKARSPVQQRSEHRARRGERRGGGGGEESCSGEAEPRGRAGMREARAWNTKVLLDALTSMLSVWLQPHGAGHGLQPRHSRASLGLQ